MSFIEAKLIGYDFTQEEYRIGNNSKGSTGYVYSRSDLHAIAINPRKWLHDNSEFENEATRWGTLIDAMITSKEPDVVIRPETYTNTAGEVKPWNANATVCREWAKENEGMIVVGSDEYANAKYAAKRIVEDPDIKQVLNGCKYQAFVAGDWLDEATGVVIPVKCLIDIVPQKSNALVDLKTTRNACATAWARTCFDYWYHVQSALYLDLWNAAMNDNRCRFLHIVQENQAPYEIARREISDQFIRLGRAQYEQALSVLAKCIKENEWPGYDEKGEWSLTDAEPWMVLRCGVQPKDSAMPF